jgi:TolA-binding protein
MSQEFATTQPQADPKPAPNPPVKPEPAPRAQQSSMLPMLNLATLLASLALLGYLIYQQREMSHAERPVAAEAQKAEKSADDPKTDLDKLRDELKGLTRRFEDHPAPPDPAPRFKVLDDRMVDLGNSLKDLNDRYDGLGKKVESVSKGEGTDTPSRIDAIEKRVGTIAATLQGIKSDASTRTASAEASSTDMDRAVDLFKKGKYAEAKETFARLQGTSPDDARVWYYSALASGLANGDWKGEGERLVALGEAREKAGTPARAKIDAAFADLTTATGKDWLAYYRNKAAR